MYQLPLENLMHCLKHLHHVDQVNGDQYENTRAELEERKVKV